jgi:hypothetical protein
MSHFRFGLQLNLQLKKEHADRLASFAAEKGVTKTQAAKVIVTEFLEKNPGEACNAV